MPKFRLTKEAAHKSMKKYGDYENIEKEENELTDDQVINDKYTNIITKMKSINEGDLSKYINDRNKAIKRGLHNHNDKEIINADKAFHEKYDELFSDYSADLLAMNNSLQNLEILQKDVTEYRKYYDEAKKQFVGFFNIDEKEYDQFLNNFNAFLYGNVPDINSYLKNLDNIIIDDISDIENELGIKSNIIKEKEVKQEKINTSNQIENDEKVEETEDFYKFQNYQDETNKEKEGIINLKGKEEELVVKEDKVEEIIKPEKNLADFDMKNQIERENWVKDKRILKEGLDLYSFENSDIGNYFFEESEKFLENKSKQMNNSQNYIENILERINQYKTLDTKNNDIAKLDPLMVRNSDHQAKTIQNKIDMKKTYFGGYLKIREHFDSKNLFQKLFTLGESIQEYKALKKIKNEICDRYKIKPDTLDDQQRLYFNYKKLHPQQLENNEVEEKQQVTRTQSKEFQNSLIDSLSENKNLDTQKLHDKTTLINKTMDKGK